MSQTTDRTQSNYARANQSDHRQRNREEMQHGVVAVLDKQREKFQEILPDTVEWSDFRSCFVTAVQRNWRLLEADRESLWLALQDCALAGLRPDGKEAALVIFGDDSQDEEGNRVASTANAKKKVQLLPMVWGLTRLVHNTGLVADIRARCVYKGEHFRHWEEDGQEHYEYRREVDPDFDDDPSKIIGAFAVIQFKDGSFKMDFMSRRQIERRRAVSRAKKGPWGPWYDEQAMKTVLKHVMKGAPKSRELQRISDVLDRDDSLPTIDGEKPVEIQSEAAPTADPVRDAFQGDGRKTGQETSRRTETPPVTERAAPTTTASAPKPPPAAVPVSPIINVAADDRGFGAWLVDADGTEVRPEPYTTPEQFAIALATLCAGRPRNVVDEILEVNDGSIKDCRDASEAAAKIIDAVIQPPAPEVPTQDDKPATGFLEPTDPEPTTAASAPAYAVLPLPTTPKGSPHWGDYVDLVKAELDKFTSIDDATAWLAVQKPTYQDKSVSAETKIGRLFEDMCRRLGGGTTDPDREKANAYITEIKALTSIAEMKAMNGRPEVPADMQWLKTTRPELFAEVRAAAEAQQALLASKA